MNELFLKIVNMSMSASWIVLAVLILRLILKKAPKWVNVLLWGMVAVRLICPFSIESPVSLIPDSVGNGELVSEWMDDYIGEVSIIHDNSVYYDAAVTAGREPISDGSGGYYVVTKYDQLGEPSTIENTVMPVLTIIWASGVALLALHTAISYWRLRRKVDTAVLYKDNIFQSENVSSPFVLGIIKPRIYLPFKLDEQDLLHVVAHEQAHIRRKDHWWKPLGFLLLTIHWFNPLMWLAYVLLCRDIELACDEKVIKELGSEQRADYTQALVACSVSRSMIAACPLAFGEVGVKERVKSVMNYKKPAFWIILLSIIACAVVAVCFLTNPVDNEPDLSFLNYENAISLVADVDEVVAIYCPSSDDASGDSIQIGATTGADLAKQLDRWDWKECTAPRQPLPSPGSVEFVIDDDYRITVHQRKSGSLRQYAVVEYQDDVRYYRIGRNDYPDAVALVHTPGTQSNVFQARILEIHEGYFLVEPAEGSSERNSADQIEVPMQNMDPALEPQVGDVIEISYSGEILETYPARLAEVYSIRVTQEAEIWDKRPMLMMDGNYYVDPYMPVSRLPYGYTLSGALTQEQAYNTGLEGNQYYQNPNANDFYVYQLCGTPIDINTVDTEQRQWAYVRWIPVNEEAVKERKLTLDDVIMLSEKGQALTWSDFDLYKYVEGGSGLYIRIYEIDELFSLWIGGSGPDSDPMYIYLALADDMDTRIDIRDGGVTEFISAHNSTATAFELNFAGNTSLQHTITLTEEKPYWRIWIVNEGSETIVVELAGDVYKVEPGTSDTIYADEKWEPGTYIVGFASTVPSGMEGRAVCEISSTILPDEESAIEGLDN